MPEDNQGTPLSEDQNPNPENQEGNIPDWMKDAGWGKDSGTFDESKPVFDNVDDEDDIVPADIPAWLEEAAPDGFSTDPNATPAFEGLNDEGSFITTGDLVPRTPPKEISSPPASDPVEEPETIKSEPELDIPSWLKNLELDEDSQETAVAWLENMPEDLRATDEEIAASNAPKPETLEPQVDELAWMDDLANQPEKEPELEDLTQAELSEDLVASELIPEQGTEEQIFGQEEIQSMESDAPAWLDELAEEPPPTPARTEAENIDSSPPPPAPQDDESGVDLMPDWLSDLAADEPAPVAPGLVPDNKPEQPPEGSSDMPDWLGEFEPSAEDGQSTSTQEEIAEPEIPEFIPEASKEAEGDVSPLDETLNTQVPDWLSKIGDTEEDKEETGAEPAKNDFDESASWLDEIDKPIEDGAVPEVSAADGEVMDWLENMDEKPEELTAFDDLRDSLTAELEVEEPEQKPAELETAKYFTQEEETSESMPDWLSELASDDADNPTSLESAIRQSDHSLSPEETDFLEQVEETQDENADWLAKLDLTDDEITPEAEIPAIKEDLPEEDAPIETPQTQTSDDPAISGSILDRLNTPEDTAEPVVPQWLENLKKEEDPQETAVLWLKQFVERGAEVNLQDEIKRYTDELNPGDTVPKWMEDLKHEEDPQTTAMLWLEKLAAERPAPEKPKPPKEEVEAGWLAELEKEAEEQSQDIRAEPVKDFQDTNNGWLADLEIDEKLKTEEPELPDWSSSETEETQESDTPL